jgi:hypothetical protein
MNPSPDSGAGTFDADQIIVACDFNGGHYSANLPHY